MNSIKTFQSAVKAIIQKTYHLSDENIRPMQVTLQVGKSREFGDFSCNAAMVLAKHLKQAPRELATQMKGILLAAPFAKVIETIEIAGPGFLNITMTPEAWHKVAQELFLENANFFKLDESEPKLKYNIEFVSANPTGPLHLGHGRGGIIGDVLAKVLNSVGHEAKKEFYINDAGNQMQKLGDSLKIRCQQELGEKVELPEGSYQGEYLIPLAKELASEHGKKILNKENTFFTEYASRKMLSLLKETLTNYGITFDTWFSEKALHQVGAVKKAILQLKEKDLVYEKEDALWFRSTKFGDDKDRVIKKSDGTYTYIAADIAYHINKFDRGFDKLIDILGQDHHGYVSRLKATMQAAGYEGNRLEVILYQLVKVKRAGELIKMSKRSGIFETLADIIEAVGKDVARFFYLNRKADAHLDFDLDVALKKTDENPVYYIQYAYVRTNSLLKKAQDHEHLAPFIAKLKDKTIDPDAILKAGEYFSADEIALLKKICSFDSVLQTIVSSYQTHLLSYYTLELAKEFHAYYARNKIIDPDHSHLSESRLVLVKLIQQTLSLCLELLGVSKPEVM